MGAFLATHRENRLIKALHINRFAQSLRSIGRRDAVFVWIPKTAGTSVFEVLKDNGCLKAYTTEEVRCEFPQRGLVTFAHMDYGGLVREGYVTQSFDRSAYKFAFCRNPYDRAVSLYYYLRSRDRIDRDHTFLSFCRQLRDEGPDAIGLYNWKGTSQCNPQVAWLEGVELDFIGRFESIDEDFNRVLAELGSPSCKLPTKNKIDRKNYRDYYCDESRSIIADLYRNDFAAFGYATDL